MSSFTGPPSPQAKQRSLAEQLELRDLEVARLQKEMAGSRSAWTAIESVQQQVDGDEKVANRDIRVWHSATENGP